RIVGELDADYFVFENVKGLTVGRHRGFLDEVIAAFQDLGYAVRLPWRVLNAVQYGTPQNRERLILIGAKPGLALPQYPAPMTRAAGTSGGLASLPEGPSVAEALGDLPEPELFAALMERDWVDVRQWGEAGRYAREMRCLDNDAWHFGYPRAWNPSRLTSS